MKHPYKQGKRDGFEGKEKFVPKSALDQGTYNLGYAEGVAKRERQERWEAERKAERRAEYDHLQSLQAEFGDQQ